MKSNVAATRGHPVSPPGHAIVRPAARQYLNRLSDLLFVMARVANRRDGAPEFEW